MSGAVHPSRAYSLKRRRELVTPEGIAVPVTVAARGSRVGALILDYVIIIFAMIAIDIILGLIYSGLPRNLTEGLEEQMTGAGEFVTILYILAIFIVRYGYFLGMELGPRGATWGKRAVSIRVAARDGGRLTPEAVVARNLMRDIELFLPISFIFIVLIYDVFDIDVGNATWMALIWFMIFMAFPFFNKDALRAGDVIAGTWVVEAPRTKLAGAMTTHGAAVTSSSDVTGARYEFGEEELSIYGEHELQVLERMLREAQPEALSAVHATICNKIGWHPGAGDERAFLEAFYAQLRAKLEGDMRFGVRKADKFS